MAASSWASIVKSSKQGKVGYELAFFPNEDGKCIITKDDVKDACEKWKRALVGIVLGHNPSFFVMKKFVEDKWGKDGNIQVSKLKNGTFIFLFENEDHKNRILEQGPWLFFSKILVLKPWCANVKFDDDIVKTLPIWIRLSKLNLQYFNPIVLGKLASLLGKPLLVDEPTASGSRLDFARVCIEISPTFEFPNSIKFWNENGEEVTIDVEYEWKPSRCPQCVSFGHSIARCPRIPTKVAPTKVWVPKVAHPKNQGEASSSKRVMSQPQQQPAPSTIDNANPFEALLELGDSELPQGEPNKVIPSKECEEGISANLPLVIASMSSNENEENGNKETEATKEDDHVVIVEPIMVEEPPTLSPLVVKEETTSEMGEDIEGLEEGQIVPEINAVSSKAGSKLLLLAKDISLKEKTRVTRSAKRGNKTSPSKLVK